MKIKRVREFPNFLASAEIPKFDLFSGVMKEVRDEAIGQGLKIICIFISEI